MSYKKIIKKKNDALISFFKEENESKLNDYIYMFNNDFYNLHWKNATLYSKILIVCDSILKTPELKEYHNDALNKKIAIEKELETHGRR